MGFGQGTEAAFVQELEMIKIRLEDRRGLAIIVIPHKKLDLNVETVRNYFGGANYNNGEAVGIHIEQGPDGGIVILDDTTILDMALELSS